MTGEKTGEELLSSISDNTTEEEFELLFTHLSNHISWFKAEQNLSDTELDRLLSRVWEAIQIKIDGARNPIQVKSRLEKVLENMRKSGGPIVIN